MALSSKASMEDLLRATWKHSSMERKRTGSWWGIDHSPGAATQPARHLALPGSLWVARFPVLTSWLLDCWDDCYKSAMGFLMTPGDRFAGGHLHSCAKLISCSVAFKWGKKDINLIFAHATPKVPRFLTPVWLQQGTSGPWLSVSVEKDIWESWIWCYVCQVNSLTTELFDGFECLRMWCFSDTEGPWGAQPKSEQTMLLYPVKITGLSAGRLPWGPPKGQDETLEYRLEEGVMWFWWICEKAQQ